MELKLIRPELLTMTAQELRALYPILILVIGSLLAIVLSVIKLLSPKFSVFFTTVLVSVAAGLVALDFFGAPPVPLFNHMMVVDPFSTFFTVLFVGALLVSCLVSFRYLDREKIQHPEYYILMLFSVIGMILMASSLDLIVLFIALELMSLSVYVLVGFRRADRRSNEAAIKYFILGSVASAILLYGAAILYGCTGTMNLAEILPILSRSPEVQGPLFVVGMWLVVVGFLFKVASVPFHMWMPDIYEGAPTPVTGFMTSGIKAAAFATFLRVLFSLGYGKAMTEAIQVNVHDLLWVIAVATMVVGNLIALTQTNLKRMLAYSSIAHTGYLMIGLLSGHKSEFGYAPIAMYLVGYSIMNLGAFALLSMVGGREDHGLNLQDFSGLGKREPWLAFAMSVFLFSMAGVPPTAGFVSKYFLLYGAVQAGEVPLVVIAVLCSAVSVYYYLRVLVYMYMKDPVGAPSGSRHSLWAGAALTAMVVLTLQVGIMPARLFEMARVALASF